MTTEPRFDLSNLSWKDSKQLSALQIRVANATEARDEDALMNCFDGMQMYLTRVVRDVPKAWLVGDAPPALDWSDPTSYDWLRADKMTALMRALADAQSAEGASKN
jgi:hypothetical protein